MLLGNWITLSAVIIALTLGVLAMIQTKRIQQRQYKHMLINEIIDWATEIIEVVRVENMPIVGITDIDTARARVMGNKYFKLWGIDAKTEYMKHIAIFFPQLIDKTEEVQQKLDTLSENFWSTFESRKGKFDEIVAPYFRAVDKSAAELITLATQEKTKNL